MKKIFYLLLMSLFVAACSGSDDNDGTSVSSDGITCNVSEVNAPAEGGEYTLTVNATRGEWSAYSSSDWITVKLTGTNKSQGTVTVTVDANTTKASRTGNIILMSGKSRKEIPVRQSTPTSVSTTQLYFGSDVESQTITIGTSNDWSATADASWLTVEKTNPTTLTVKTTANTDTKARTATITVVSGGERIAIGVYQLSAEDNNITAPAGYTLVWHDEFNEGTAPKTGTNGWWYETGHGSNGWGNNEIQNYVDGTSHPDVCSIKDGYLSITARKVGSEVQSIRMNTSQAWTYGYFEARLMLPKGKGTWPAFWMMPKNFTTWPGDGEIDIMEEVGFNPNYVLSTIHCNKYNNTGTSTESAGRSVPTAQTEFHVYACEWTAENLKFYIDGSLLLNYKNDGTGYNAWPFNTPFYLKLNLAWGGDWGGAQGIDESALPATYMIDYVRVYQKK